MQIAKARPDRNVLMACADVIFKGKRLHLDKLRMYKEMNIVLSFGSFQLIIVEVVTPNPNNEAS